MAIIESGNKTLSKFGIIFPMINAPKYFYETLGGETKMKIKVKKALKLDDGKHEGVINDVKYRDDPYNYCDVVVGIDDAEITVGYPTVINAESALGQLLVRFGAKLEIGKDLEPEEFLTKGKEVVFQTVKQKNKKDGKEYSNIMKETLKPKE